MHYMKSLCRTLYCIVWGSQWLLLTKVWGCKGQEEGTLTTTRQYTEINSSIHRNQLVNTQKSTHGALGCYVHHHRLLALHPVKPEGLRNSQTIEVCLFYSQEMPSHEYLHKGNYSLAHSSRHEILMWSYSMVLYPPPVACNFTHMPKMYQFQRKVSHVTISLGSSTHTEMA